MIGKPCLNPSCKSHGLPHPNCKCYSGMAEGGDVGFCSEDRTHDPSCEFYAEGGEVPTNDLPEANNVPDNDLPKSNNDEVPEHDLPKAGQEVPETDIANPYNTLEQKIKTGLEGAAEGATFGLSVPVEKYLGVKQEDIANRAATNPISHSAGQVAGVIGSAFIPFGEGAALAKIGQYLNAGKDAGWGLKIASGAVKTAVDLGLMQAGDETANYFAGQGNPLDVAANHIAGAAYTGLKYGGAFGVLGTALEKAQAANLGHGIEKFAQGIEGAIKNDPHVENADIWYSKGHKFYNELEKSMSSTIAGTVGATAAGASGVMAHSLTSGLVAGNQGYTIAQKFLQPMIEKTLGKPLGAAGRKIVVPLVMRAIQTGETFGVVEALNYGTSAAKGADVIAKSLNMLFKPGVQQAYDYNVSEPEREKIKSYIDSGGIDQEINKLSQSSQSQGFAHGGAVHANPAPDSSLATLYPDQNILLNETKARVSNHLQMTKPQKFTPKLPYDSKHHNPEADRNYEMAVNLAAQPLSILNHIKKGTLLPEQISHLNQMYPGVFDLLKQKITEKMIHSEINKERPSYPMRQSLSLFMGTPVDSTFTSASIQAAQSVFANQSASRQGAQPTKGGGKPAKLDQAPKSYLTPDQAAISRQQRAR